MRVHFLTHRRSASLFDARNNAVPTIAKPSAAPNNHPATHRDSRIMASRIIASHP